MANQNQDLMNIFDLSVKDIDTYDRGKKESIIYKPSPDQGRDGIYRSLIRFIPNPKNVQKSIVRKFVYWLKDEEGNYGLYDAPSTIGEKDPIQETFFKLRKSESAVQQKMAEELKRRETFYSIVQIIKDPHNPELEGKLKIFKYGQKIKEKIDNELAPQFDEPTQIFDLFEGKNFELTITKQSSFPNYDQSKFQSKKSAIILDGKYAEKSDKNKIIEYIGSAPDLTEFEFKPWDEETRTKINNILSMFRTTTGKAVSAVTKQPKVDFEDTPILTSPVAEDYDFNEKPSAPAKKSSGNASDASEDITAFLSDLGI
jgi:hypothetical protein